MFVIGSALLITAILVSGSAISTNYVAEKLLANEARSAMFTLHNSTDEMAAKPNQLYAAMMLRKGFTSAVMSKNAADVEKTYTAVADSEALFAAFYGSDGSLIWKSADCPDNISYDKNAANGLVSDSDRLYFRYTAEIQSGDTAAGGCVIGCDLKDYVTLGQYTGIQYDESTLTVKEEDIQKKIDAAYARGDYAAAAAYTAKLYETKTD